MEKGGFQGWYFAHKTVKRMGQLPFDAQPGEKYDYGYRSWGFNRGCFWPNFKRCF